MAESSKKDKQKDIGKHKFDPTKYINTTPAIEEAIAKTVVIAWGRMNPITAGHEKLVKKVAAVAKAEKGLPMVFLTHSFDKKKNPLAYDDKLSYAQKAFGPIIQKSNAKTIFQLLKDLNRVYKRVVYVAGSDRVDEFTDLLNKYNGKEYNFSEIKIVSAGQRDPDSDDVSGISGTKMRQFAIDKNIKSFAANLPKNIKSDAEDIMTLVRKGMNMSESKEIHINEMAEPELDEALDRQQRRQRSIAMKRARFKIKRGREKALRKTASVDVLKKRAKKAAINVLKQKFAKNRRYAELSPGEKEVIDKRIEKINKKRIEAMARKLFPKVKQAEKERRSNLSKGSTKNESINEASEKDMQVRKRPHMLMDKNNKPKFDARFRFFKKKNDLEESVEDLSEEILNLMEATEALAEKELKKGKDDPCWKNYVQLGMKKNKDGKEVPNCVPKESAEFEKDAELLERSTDNLVKTAISKVMNRKNYKNAAEYAKKSGKKAADVARMYSGVDARELASMIGEEVELDEAIKFKINKNTYFMGKDVGPVHTHHSGYSIAKIGKDWVVSTPDDEESGKYKSLAAAKSAVADMVNEEVELEESRAGRSLGDYEKRSFKRKEHEAEWKRDQEIERNKKKIDSEEHHVYINGKVWKKDGKPVPFNGKKHANSAAVSILKKDPKKEVKLTHHSYTTKHGGTIKEEGGAGEEGTNKLVNKYKKDTPDA